MRTGKPVIGLFWILQCTAIAVILAWSLIDPENGGRAYVVIAGGAVASFFLYQFAWFPNSLPKNAVGIEFDSEERLVLRKYHCWFKYPTLATVMTSLAAWLQMTSILSVPWFLYNSQWAPAAVGAFSLLFGPYFRLRFDPLNYLRMAVIEKPGMGFEVELGAIDRVAEKLTLPPR